MPNNVDLDSVIGARIREMRRKRERSLVELGHHLGLSYQQVRKYELGTNRISATMLLRVAQALDVDISYFFDGLASDERSEPTGVSTETLLDEALQSIGDAHLRSMLRDLIITLRQVRR